MCAIVRGRLVQELEFQSAVTVKKVGMLFNNAAIGKKAADSKKKLE